jgi:hypothetical protein
MFMPSVRRSAFFFALNFRPLIGLIRLILTDFLSSRWERIRVNLHDQPNQWSISLAQ